MELQGLSKNSTMSRTPKIKTDTLVYILHQGKKKINIKNMVKR